VDTETGFGQGREKDTGGKPPVSQKCKPLSLSGDAANPSGRDSAGSAKGKGFTLEGPAGMWDEAWWEEVDEAETIPPAASLLEVLEDPTEEAEEALTLLEGSAPPSPAAGQVPATELSRIRQRLAGPVGSRYPGSATEGASEATEAAQAAPVPPEQPKRK